MARVLIADHSEFFRTLIRRTLEIDDHEVIEATDGGHALELLAAHRPELVVLDVVLPRLDGLSVCRVVRADPWLRRTALIILSADADAEGAIDAGADRFVSKPFRPFEVLAVVDELLQPSQRPERRHVAL